MAMEARASPSIPRRGSSKDLPFYQVPDDKITPAKIVSEAKNALEKRGPLNPLMITRRPETPRDDERKLFGEQSDRDPTNRPPSAFSLGSRHFDSESRPVSGTRLTPIDHIPKVSELEYKAPKPPTDPSRRRASSRTKALQQSVSVDSSNDGHPPPRSSSYHDNLNNAVAGERRTGSGETKRERRHAIDGEHRSHRRSADGEMLESGYGSDVARVNSAGSQGGEAYAGSRGGSASSQGPGSAGKSRSAGSERVPSGGKPGSGGRREEAQETHIYNTRIAPIIDEMATHIKDKDPDRLLALSEELYSELERADLLGKNCRHRSFILKTIFKLLDLVSPRLLLKLARLILALKVSGNNLTNVCKLVFKVSKDEKNDLHFTEGNILDLLVETTQWADHISSADALVYCVGALKFLSGTGTVIKVLAKRHCMHAMAMLLASINKTVSETGKPHENLGHILVQLTATLRNLAEVPSKRPEFITDRVLQELCCVMFLYFNDGDLMLNVVRIYSKLSVHNDVCTAMAQAGEPKYFKCFIDLLNKYKKREDIIVRVCYILGNLTAKADEARQRLWDTYKSLDTLLAILKNTLTADLHSRQHNPSSDGDAKSGKTVDVLVKAVRVVANLSINQDIGPQIAATDQCVHILIQILENPYLSQSEELLINTMSTVNNLSYYTIKDSAITSRQLQLADSLSRYIRKDNMDVLAEAIRVFGNLTRDRTTRQFMYKHKLDEMMVDLLNANDKEVVFTACGVLINLMADDDRRSMLKKQGGIARLISVLKDFARGDWQLGSMVCQILWNYSGKITSSNAMFGEVEAQELADTLVDLLDEDDVLLDGPDSEELREFTLQMWHEDFCPVARQLLDRVDQHQSDFETLENPS